jgi:hypothetical protein
MMTLRDELVRLLVKLEDSHFGWDINEAEDRLHEAIQDLKRILDFVLPKTPA